MAQADAIPYLFQRISACLKSAMRRADDPAWRFRHDYAPVGAGQNHPLQRLPLGRWRGPAFRASPPDGRRMRLKRSCVKRCREGMVFEWTDLVYPGKTGRQLRACYLCAGGAVGLLITAAQYSSWSLPFAVLLIAPMSLLSAIVSACGYLAE